VTLLNNIPYDFTNAFFRESDVRAQFVNGFEIPAGWWSRGYEYRFAMEFAEPGLIVADMGCGWHYRPLHDYLANVCDFVYGVDHHEEVLQLPAMDNGAFVVADLSKPIQGIPAGSLDRIFCISVLEEMINYAEALTEFKRLLKPGGYMVLTLDAPYDANLPAHELYKGVDLNEFEAAMRRAGLSYHGSVCRVREEDALHNDEFNLCVWHCVLKHTPLMPTSE
jgi:trans-aconitate methyltransferase